MQYDVNKPRQAGRLVRKKTMPKTWTADEIKDLITKEIRGYTQDCADKNLPFSVPELSELILEELNSKGLIEFTP